LPKFGCHGHGNSLGSHENLDSIYEIEDAALQNLGQLCKQRGGEGRGKKKFDPSKFD